jgi:HSP20 family molecular chaperone IbpA
MTMTDRKLQEHVQNALDWEPSFEFPEPVDPARVSAEHPNGMLCVTAPLAQPATKVEVQVA